jgi:hypothetical protein
MEFFLLILALPEELYKNVKMLVHVVKKEIVQILIMQLALE